MKTTRTLLLLSLIFLLPGSFGILTGCNVTGGVQGNGNVMKETRKVSSFDAIDVSGAFDIVLKQGPAEEVVVESDANLLPVIRTEVVGETLVIETKRPVRNVTLMKVYVTVKTLKRIETSGAVDLETEGRLDVPELSMDASGASDSKLNIAVQQLSLDCSGASKIRFEGSATRLNMDLSGASDIFAYDLLTETCEVDISGAGNAQLNVSKKIRAEISGAGSVKYKGSPSDVDQQVSGAGSIRKVD